MTLEVGIIIIIVALKKEIMILFGASHFSEISDKVQMY